MEILAVVLRLLMSSIFAVAGFAKLSDINKSQAEVEEFGVPHWAARLIGILLPATEIATAIILLPVRTVFWGSLAASVLLLVFIVAISINLTSGRKPNCNCFGQIHSEPIGWPLLLRDFVFL